MNGRDLLAASDALRAAFAPEDFDQLLVYRLDRRRSEYAAPGTFRSVVFDVLTAAQREGWLPRLLSAAREANPGNAELMAVAERLQLAPVRAEAREPLERLLGRQPGFVDSTAFRERLGTLEGQVGRVELPVPGGLVTGTAFLVGPDSCLTNQHVLAPVLDGAADAADVVVRFDYRRDAGGTVLNPGTEVRLRATDWLLDASPPSPLDSVPGPGGELPADDQLDYVLVRLAGEPGREPLGAAPLPNAPTRGWIRPAPAAAAAYAPDSPLFVLQHPSGEPLKLAFATVVGLNGNQTRLRHRVDTEPGSSGSPCFDRDLALVGVHHGGDPNYAIGHRPAYNEAVPLPAIRRLLARRGVAAFPEGPR